MGRGRRTRRPGLRGWWPIVGLQRLAARMLTIPREMWLSGGHPLKGAKSKAVGPEATIVPYWTLQVARSCPLTLDSTYTLVGLLRSGLRWMEMVTMHSCRGHAPRTHFCRGRTPQTPNIYSVNSVSACLPCVQNVMLFCTWVSCLASTINEMCLDHLQCHLAQVGSATTVATS